ncbi:MAG TPA: Gfo/Idh/MocA family oxidoreductase [Tepidisphaeraceae bacterium]|jgi:predicted dehydrogenase
MNEPLPVGVVGCGRMGKLHARVYSQMPSVKLVGIFDVDHERAQEVADEYKTKAYSNLTDLVQDVAAITLAVPTNFHLETAKPFLEKSIACLIEKPLARNSHECRQIQSLAQQHAATVQVGHIERFNPIIRSLSRLGISPRFMEVTRISPLTFRSIDVGVVLDMMIHDIDIVLMLARSKVSRIDAVGVSVIGQVEDICNARLTFENGCVANLTASRLALKTERKLRLFSPESYVSLDYQKKYGIVARRSGNLDAIRQAVQKIRAGEVEDLSQLNYADLVNVEELQIDDTEPLRAELDAFIEAVVQKHRPIVSVEDGTAAVEVAERIVEAIGNQNV